MHGMTIGGLARATGVSVDTIRFYERAGLLTPPPRAGSGFRRYGDGAVAELSLIRDLRAAGVPLEELRELLPVCRETPSAGDARLLERHLKSIDARIGALQSCRHALQSMLP